MKSLFAKRNPLAVASKKKKNRPNCINCPGNKDKKMNHLDIFISDKADVLFILPSTKHNAIRKRVRAWQKKETNIDKISFIPDVLCKHDISEDDNAYAIRNLHCSYLLQKKIKASRIKHVFLVGQGAVRAYFGEDYNKDVSYVKVRGFTMPDLENDLLLSFVYEPSMEALMGDTKEACILEHTIFSQDLQKGLNRVGTDIEERWRKPLEYCHVVGEEKAVEYMEDILRGVYKHFVAFDYEATGLKPFREGQKLYTCSLCPSRQFSFAFVMTDATNVVLGKILANRNIPKVAANNPYEYKMSKYLMGFNVNNLIYDCCIGAHIQDLRRGITGVKFQARMRYGIRDYEKGMKQFLVPSEKETDKHGANAINTIMSAPQNSLLVYNAMDSLLEYWLAIDSMNEMSLEY